MMASSFGAAVLARLAVGGFLTGDADVCTYHMRAMQRRTGMDPEGH